MFVINVSANTAKIISNANYDKYSQRNLAGIMFDVIFRVMNSEVTIVALPNTFNDFADVQKINALKKGIILVATIATTYGLDLNPMYSK